MKPPRSRAKARRLYCEALVARVPLSRRRVLPRALPAVLCAIAALTLGVTLADSTPVPNRALPRASSAQISPAPPRVPNNGCPAKPQYVDTHPGQNFLCGSAPNKQFYPGPLDVVWASGKGDKIWAQNTKPNEIHGVASDTAYVDPSTARCTGFRRNRLFPSVRPARRGQRAHPTPTRLTTAELNPVRRRRSSLPRRWTAPLLALQVHPTQESPGTDGLVGHGQTQGRVITSFLRMFTVRRRTGTHCRRTGPADGCCQRKPENR